MGHVTLAPTPAGYAPPANVNTTEPSPSGLTGSLATLNWQPVTGATNYVIDREWVASGVWQTNFATTNGTAFLDQGNTNGGYVYRVSAVAAGISSAPSAQYPLQQYAVISLDTNDDWTDPFGLIPLDWNLM